MKEIVSLFYCDSARKKEEREREREIL